MSSLKILVFHPAAIGDAVLATPVSVNLKHQFPNSKITYFTHASLIPLLSLCKFIDDFIACDGLENVSKIRSEISKLKPDMIFDLSGSMKSYFCTFALAKKIFHYRKENSRKKNKKHAVDNYLDSFSRDWILDKLEKFPSLVPASNDIENVRLKIGVAAKPLIAIVPGVGNLRPHRAWSEKKIVLLIKQILKQNNHEIILIGGKEENILCSNIVEVVGSGCYNLAGELSLRETAAALGICDVTISGDTGPAHISCAVGTKVIGLYGPTALERSGPYGMSELCINVHDKCKCWNKKNCVFMDNDNTSACMQEISVESVYQRLDSLMPKE